MSNTISLILKTKKSASLIIAMLTVLLVTSAKAQFGGGVNISGPSSVTHNTTHTYTAYSLGTIYSGSWTASGGQILSSSSTSCQVKWTSTGTRSISGYFNTSYGSSYDSHTVTVNSPAPSTPSNPYISSSNTCGNKTIQRNNPPSGTVWYWQGTNSSGTSTSNSSLTYNVSSSGRYYLRARKNGVWSSSSSSVWVTIYSNLTAGSINGTQTICYGGNPSNLSNASSAGGCTGTLTYQWQYSNNGSSGWTNISGATGSSYDPPGGLTSSRWYRRRAQRGGQTKYTSSRKVTVYGNLSAGSINGTQTICYGGDPGTLGNASSPSGGNGSYSYQWQYSNNGSSGWTNISSATSSTYNPPSGLTASRWYRRRVISCSQTKYTGTIKVTVNGNLNAGSISGTQTICYSGDPGTLGNASSPSGGNGSYSYQWQYSTNNSSFSNISGATSSTYNPPAGLTADRWYRRRVISCGQTKYTGSIKVTVHPTLSPGGIYNTQTICYNGDPIGISSAIGAYGGDGNYSYQWQYSDDNSSFSNISGATALTYNPPSGLTADRWYRRRAVSCGQTVYSSSVKVTVHPDLTPGTIYSTQTTPVCYNGDPSYIGTGVSPQGGDGNYTYQWQYAYYGSPWFDISGATSSSYNPGNITSTRYYRKKVMSCGQTKYTTSVQITVNPELAPGTLTEGYTICYNGDPGTIWHVYLPTGGDGIYSYQWQYSDDNSTFTDIPGATILFYDPPAGLTADRWYRRADSSCGQTVYTSAKKFTVHDELNVGTISDSQTICYNTSASTLNTSTGSTGGDGMFTYQWEQRTPGGSWTNAAGTSTNENYDPGALTTTMEYRRQDSSCGATAISNTVTVTVNPALTAGTIYGEHTICANNDANAIFNYHTPTGGDGTISYQWEERTPGGSWVNATGINFNPNYDPGVLTTTMEYRRQAQSCGATETSNVIVVTVLSAGATPVISDVTYGLENTSLQLDSAAAGETRYWQTSAGGEDETNSDNPYLISTPGTYHVRAKAANGCWGGAASFDMQASEPTALGATTLSAEEVLINWTAATGNETGFVIKRSTSSSGSYQTVHNAGPSDTQYTDDYLATGTTYYYKVQAQQAGQTSVAPTIIQATTADTFIGDETLAHEPAYNGNISAIRWENAVDQLEQVYTFDYDAMNRLTSASYAADAVGTFSKDKGYLSVPSIGYDLNGNILNLKRQGNNNAGNADIIDELTYEYDGNRLKTVDDLRGEAGFKDGEDDLDVEYFYDANGNMVKDLNKGIDSIYYNHLNLPFIIDMEKPGDSIVYVYDARGIKLQQRVYQADTLYKTTDYVGEFVYETLGQGPRKLQFIQHEEGRLVPGTSAGSYDYQYHIKDHLSNTRVTFTSACNVSGYLATFEDATYAQDTTDFFNVDPRVSYPVGGKAVRLNSAAPIGPGFAAAISPGDTINISVKAYYEDATGHGTSSLGATTLAAALTTAYGGLNGGSEGQQLIHDVFNNHAGAAVAAGGTGNDAQPSAYLNYLVFDEDYNLVSDKTGYVGVPLGNNLEWTLQVDELVIEQAGFVYIYVSNESVSSNYVYFDNLDVAISESPILEAQDYYPFGLTFNSYTKPGTIGQRYKFNSKEEQNDLGFNVLDYGARMMDPALGRWSVVDPMSEMTLAQTPYHYTSNNPVSHIDPTGMYKVYINGKRVRGRTKQAAIESFGLPGGSSGDGGRNSTVGDASTYANGAIVTNEYGAYQNQNGEMVDISFNPSISPNNRTYYVYNSADLKIRSALSKVDNVIWQQIQILEQRGVYVPLSTKGYKDDFYGKYGSEANPDFWMGAQFMQMTLDVMSGNDAANAKAIYRSLRRSGRKLMPRGVGKVNAKAKAQFEMRKESVGRTYGKVISNRVIKNRWNRFLHKTKGTFKGKNWMQDARDAYYKWRMGN